MLILAFGFRVATRPRPPIATLSSKISPVQRGIQELFPIYLHRLILRFGTTSLERCLVLPPCGGIKLIYCASIKQRERNCFRQLNLWPLGLGSQQTTLRMLTYHSNPLSNPVNPLLLFTSLSMSIVATLDKNDYLWTANLLFLSFIAKSLAVFFLFARKFM